MVPHFLLQFVGCRLPLFVARFREVCQAIDQFRLRLRPANGTGRRRSCTNRLEHHARARRGKTGRPNLCSWGREGRALSSSQRRSRAPRLPIQKRNCPRATPPPTQREGLATRQRTTTVVGSALYGNWGAGVNDESSRCGRWFGRPNVAAVRAIVTPMGGGNRRASSVRLRIERGRDATCPSQPALISASHAPIK